MIYFDNIIFGDSSLLDTPSFQSTQINLSPNPASDRFAVRADTTIDHLAIYDPLGQMVLDLSPNAASFSVDISALNSGMYLLRMSEGNRTTIKKLIKK